MDWWDILTQSYLILLPIFAGYVVWALQTQRKRKRADSRGIMLLLRQQMEWIHDKYMAMGEIPRYALENFDEIHSAYIDLKGNGIAKKMYEDVHALPLVNERVKEHEAKLESAS